MVKKYRVGLSEEERQELKALVSKGRAAQPTDRPTPESCCSATGTGLTGP